VRHGRTIVVAIAVALGAGRGAAFAAAKTDVIVLRNGDHITGEVDQMRQGKLKLKTDDSGTLSIEWDKIVSVTTAGEYDVTLRDGTRLLGRLMPGPAPALRIAATGGVETPVPMADIVSMTTIKVGFLKRIDGSFDLGGSYTQSSGVADVYMDTTAYYRRPAFTYGAQFSTNLTRQPEAPETFRYSLKVNYTRYRKNQWFVSGLGFFESNEDLGFTFRGTGAASVGRYLKRTNRAELLVAGGLAAGREIPVDESAVTNIDAMGAMDLSVFTYDYPTTRVDVGLLVFPSLNDPGRVRVNANGKLKRELFHDFFVSVTAYDAFDSRPRTAGAERNDAGASFSFGWTF